MFSAIRAFGFGALYRIVGIRFAVAFALLISNLTFDGVRGYMLFAETRV